MSIMVNRHIETSGGCPICGLEAEDILHLLFKCPTTKSMWKSLGFNSLVEDAMAEDRARSAVMESIFKRKASTHPGYNIGVSETVAVASWYLWWIHRRRTQK
jgi:hypothetical protein